MAEISVAEMKSYLNIDGDNSNYDSELQYLIDAAKEDLITATGKQYDADNALMRQFIKLYAYREFNMANDSALDNRLFDIQKKILHSLRFSEAD